VRNSSLVEWSRAENVTGLKLGTEATESLGIGRGALSARRSRTVRSGGVQRSENAGMSSEKKGENPFRRKPKVS
jgi:hypothetical protein